MVIDTSPDAILSLPTLEELGVPQEILDAALDLFDASEGSGCERYILERALRLIVFELRSMNRLSDVSENDTSP